MGRGIKRGNETEREKIHNEHNNWRDSDRTEKCLETEWGNYGTGTRVLRISLSHWVCIEDKGLFGGEDGKDSMHYEFGRLVIN